MILDIFPVTLRFLLTSLLWKHPEHLDVLTPRLSFHLRHQHALTNTSRVIFSDIGPSQLSSHSISTHTDPYTYEVDTSHLLTHRPVSHPAFHDARLRSMLRGQNDATLWYPEEVFGPDVTDREALLALAQMSYNAYSASPDAGWYIVDGFNHTVPVGWEPDDDGLRGHVFVSEDNSTVVLSLKGTSAGWITGGGGPTVRKDKLNDNLLFSCCCARVGPTWSTVCGCYKGAGKCSQECIESALQDDDLYYSVGIHLYNNLTYMYPNSNIWIIGHSLGGSLASLVGVTFGVPVVAFEAPAEKLAATRLHLPSPPSTQHITHVIHTADPIAMGVCNGMTSACAISGYAMETRCHLGKVVLYDTVTKLKWAVDIRMHSIREIVERLLAEDLEWADEPSPGDDKTISQVTWPWWGSGDKEKDKGEGEHTKKVKLPVPVAKEEADCVDCFDWEYGEWEEQIRYNRGY